MGRAFKLAAVVMFAFCCFAGNAKADGVSELSCVLSGPVSASFILPVNPTVAPGNFFLGIGFQVDVTDLVLDGKPADYSFKFFSSVWQGGLSILDQPQSFNLISLVNLQLYRGPESSPTMLDVPGKIHLLDALSDSNYTLTITPVSTPAPEPSSVLLLGAGIVVLVLIRQRSVRAQDV
ncbi:MAG: PEP-CTERM sorting domain-containing protein [Candidatus Acidiferrales bacterium]